MKIFQLVKHESHISQINVETEDPIDSNDHKVHLLKKPISLWLKQTVNIEMRESDMFVRDIDLKDVAMIASILKKMHPGFNWTKQSGCFLGDPCGTYLASKYKCRNGFTQSCPWYCMPFENESWFVKVAIFGYRLDSKKKRFAPLWKLMTVTQDLNHCLVIN